MISCTSNSSLVVGKMNTCFFIALEKEVAWFLTEKRSKVSTFPYELYSVIHKNKDNCSTKKL